MSFPSLGVIYLMFFLSGAAALMYEVVWVDSRQTIHLLEVQGCL